MPLYEYACGECGGHLEVRQRIADDPLTTCPRCEKNGLQRLVSQSSFALKGGGWYADGYGSKKGESTPTPEDKKSTEPTKSEGTAKGDGATKEPAKSPSEAPKAAPKAANG